MQTLVLWLLAATLAAAEPPNNFARAIRQLGAADFKAREAATQQLWAAGPAAEPALEQASQSHDPEVAIRARRVLADLRMGIRPDTPPAIRDLLRNYRDGSLDEKQAMVSELVDATEPNDALLGQLSATETNPAQRALIFGTALQPVALAITDLAGQDEPDDVSFNKLMKAVRLWQVVMPEDLSVPVLLLPPLDKWGKKEQADALFAKAFAAQKKLCAQTPLSADADNNLAWLCAVARRELEAALLYAQKAVELAPKSAAYWDTAAEIEFQLGHQARALELIKKAVELEPQFHYFRQQQERMQKGDRKSLPPELNDEDAEQLPTQ